MPDSTAPETPGAATEKPKSGFLSKAIAAGVIAAIVLAEVIFVLSYLPSAEQTAAAAEQKAASIEEAQEEADPDSPTADPTTTVEVDLKRFSFSAYQNDSNTALRVDLHLAGTVKPEDREEFEKRYEKNQHRIREQIMFEVRKSRLTDLTAPVLDLIKRRILEKSNQVLGKPLLHSVVFSDFSVVAQ